MRVIDDRITNFLSTLNLGLEWIHDAGKKLVEILDRDPNAFEDILAASSATWITRDVLKTVEDIGRGIVPVESLLLPRHVLSRLSDLPPEEQVKAMNGVDVYTPPRNGKGRYHIGHKPAAKLTPAEALRVFSKTGIRTGQEQAGRFAPRQTESVGKFIVTVTHGKPHIEASLGSEIPDFQKQRIKMINGAALIELYEACAVTACAASG